MDFKITGLFVIFCIVYAIANQTTIWKTRVIGNFEPALGVYGFIVSVQIRNQHVCGGAIYNKRFVITAATCVRDISNEEISIFAGETRLNERNSPTARRFRVDNVIKKNGAFSNIKDNIALLHTTEDMETQYITSITFPNQDIPDNEPISSYICGWGANSANGIVNVLNCAQGLTITVTQCKQSIDGVDTSNICSETNENDHGPCEKDAGGPLFSTRTDEFLGIATTELSCGDNRPDVHMRAAAYKQWIIENGGISFKLNHLFLWILFIIPMII